MHRTFGIGIRIVETGEIFETETQCARRLGVTVGAVSMHLSGKTHTCAGYHLETVRCDFNHPLTADIIEDLRDITGDYACEWAEHPTRPNVYVSDSGLVAKNVRGRVELKNQNMINSGYLVASIADLGTLTSKNHNAQIHRLVAETFIPNPHGKRYVNHLDGNKLNNAACNLEWCTASENMYHAFENGLCPTERIRVVETGETFYSHAECARAIGGTSSGIHDCKTGRQRQHRGYHFEFLEDDE